MGCQSSGGRLSYCDPTTETCAFYQCLVDSDCDAGQVCDLATNSCIAGCSPACAAGTACDVPHNMCLPTTCRVDSDCPPQSSCVNLHVGGGLSCGYICASANDCNPGYSCCQAATSMDQASSTAMVCSPTTPCHGD